MGRRTEVRLLSFSYIVPAGPVAAALSLLDTTCDKRLTKTVAVVAPIAEQLYGLRQGRQHECRAFMITHLALREQHDDRTIGASQTAWSLEFGPLLVRLIQREQPLFEQAGRFAMRLEMGGIDHQSVWLTLSSGQPSEDTVEHVKATSADEAVVEGLVRAVFQQGHPASAGRYE